MTQQTQGIETPGWKTCSVCNVQFAGYHNCASPLEISYSSSETTDQKLDKIIRLLEELARKIS